MASRIEYAGTRPVAVVVTSSGDAGLAPAMRFRILGNTTYAGEHGFGWLGERTGRRNTVTAPQRRNADHVPFEPAASGDWGAPGYHARAKATAA